MVSLTGAQTLSACKARQHAASGPAEEGEMAAGQVADALPRPPVAHSTRRDVPDDSGHVPPGNSPLLKQRGGSWRRGGEYRRPHAENLEKFGLPRASVRGTQLGATAPGQS